MLDGHCNTVRGGREEKGTRIHIHWRVNIQADGVGWGGSVSLPHKLGINLGHKTEISILGSKQWLVCKVSMRAWLAREGPLRTAASVC